MWELPLAAALLVVAAVVWRLRRRPISVDVRIIKEVTDESDPDGGR